VFEWRLDSHLFFLKKEKDLKFHANQTTSTSAQNHREKM
jgi:hypothetical protein